MALPHRNDMPLLIGAKDIMSRFGMTESVFYNFIRMGMPVRKINNRLYAHIDNIDLFLRRVTVGDPIEISDDPISGLDQNGT